MRNYIPCLEHWKDMFRQYDFFIEEIKRKKLMNEVCGGDVLYMLLNFSKDVWMPITLDEKNFLIDGQHRLELAKQMGLKYIDVVIQLNLKN